MISFLLFASTACWFAVACFALALVKPSTWAISDPSEAVRWFLRAAVQGDPHAQYDLGVIAPQADLTPLPFRTRRPQDFARGTGVERNLADAGTWNGAGIPRDFQKAAKWFQRAAQQGNAGAQLILGLQYRDGLGVQQDYQLAEAWLRKAAEQGNAGAQNKLGILYFDGQGLAADDEEAAAFFARAAEQGDSHAQANLAMLYTVGRGVPRDLVQAYKWYQLAQRGDHVDRSNRLRELANSMSSEQVADAERMVTEWSPAKDSRKAEDGEPKTALLE